MEMIRIKNMPVLLLAILLGAMLSVLCMSTTAHTLAHDMHQHALVRISCTENETSDTACMPGHSSLIYALTQTSAATAVSLIFLLLTLSACFAFLTVRLKTVSKQFYKTRWRLTQYIRAEHILHWLVILHKQNNYNRVAA